MVAAGHKEVNMEIIIISHSKHEISEIGGLIHEVNENYKVTEIFNSVDEFDKVGSDLRCDLILCDAVLAGAGLLSILEKNELQDIPLMLIGRDNLLSGDAFRLNVIDYVMLPLTVEKLRESFVRVRKRVMLGEQSRMKDDDLLIKQGKMMIRSMGELYYIDYDDIFFLEAAGSYCILHFIDMDKTLMVSLNLSKVEDRLPVDRFYRIHDRHTINCTYLFSVSSCDRKCKLKNPLTKVTIALKISERRYKDFTKFINDFMLPEV